MLVPVGILLYPPCTCAIKCNTLHGIIKTERVHGTIVFFYEGKAFMGTDISVRLLFCQTIPLGKLVYQGNNILEYVPNTVFHSVKNQYTFRKDSAFS